MRRKVFALGLLLLAGAATAQDRTVTWMGNEEIKAAFTGVTINGIYGDGATFTESYAQDGRITYKDTRAALALTGRWSVINRSFCTLYDTLITGGCFRVSRHSNNCFEFYFFSNSKSEAALDLPTRPSWTARGWDKARASTCDEKPAV